MILNKSSIYYKYDQLCTYINFYHKYTLEFFPQRHKGLFQLFCFRFQYLIFPLFLNCIGCQSDFDCTNNAQCGTDRTCRCRQGFEPNGALCIDVNECQKQPDICGPFATCTNTQGGYDCRCQPPLTGNPPLEPCKGKYLDTYKTQWVEFISQGEHSFFKLAWYGFNSHVYCKNFMKAHLYMNKNVLAERVSTHYMYLYILSDLVSTVLHNFWAQAAQVADLLVDKNVQMKVLLRIVKIEWVLLLFVPI